MRRRSSVVVGLLALYFFVCPLGNLVRLSNEESSTGVSTVLLLIIVLLAARSHLKVLQHERVFQAFALLIAWMIGTSVLAPEPLDALINGGSLAIYLMAAMTAFFYLPNERLVLLLLMALCIGGLISSLITLADFVGLYDFPGVNDHVAATLTGIGYVEQASGPFKRRSAMAAYFTMIIAASFLLSLLYSQVQAVKRIILLSATFCCTLTLMLTHNRAGVLGSAIAVGLVLISTARSPGRVLLIVLSAIVTGLVLMLSLNQWFPDVWDAYETNLGMSEVATTGLSTEDSDNMRLVFADHALSSLLENPLGHGYSLLANVPGFEGILVDPHNMFTQVIWGAGVFGLLWLLYMVSRGVIQGAKLLRGGQMTQTPLYWLTLAIFGALIAFGLFNMMHNSISTGVAWLLFGALLKLEKLLRFRRKNDSSNSRATSVAIDTFPELRSQIR